MNFILTKIKDQLIPILLISIVVKMFVMSATIADSLALGFLCAVYGVELWFYLTRRHKIDKREMQRLRKELNEIKVHLATIKMEKIKVNPTQSPIGNIAWR